MTIQSLILLHKLKKAQQVESGEVYITDFKAITVCGPTDEAAVTVDLSSFKTSLLSVLAYLNDENMITQSSRYTYVKLTGTIYFLFCFPQSSCPLSFLS